MGLDIYFKARKEKIYTVLDKSKMSETEKRIYNEFDYISTPDILKNFENNSRSKLAVVKTDYPLGCFRKFNALHGYIVDNCAKGVDDCREMRVDKKVIENLISIFTKIIDARVESYNKAVNSENIVSDYLEKTFLEATINRDDWKVVATSLLPPRKGFFFGSGEVDELYFSDCVEALRLFKLMKDLIDYQEANKDKIKDEEVFEIICESSW